MRASLLVIALAFCTIKLAAACFADDSPDADAVEKLEAAKRKLAASEKHLLRYKFSKGEIVRWRVVHLATQETTIKGTTSKARSRSISTKAWRIDEVDSDGNITFASIVEDVDMAQSVTDRPDISYNSRTDANPPPLYEHVASTIGVPLSIITIDPHGRVIEREEKQRQSDIGVGEAALVLPSEPIAVGFQWATPDQINVRASGDRVQRIKLRQLYTLEEVKTGLATISVKTEVLTPVRDSRVKAQLAQQLSNGTIKFDIDAGRIVRREMKWDERVFGINGDDGVMQYLAQFREELLPEEAKSARRDD